MTNRPQKHYTAYIDEAGDEGFGKLATSPVGGQSRWFVIGACVVTREKDLQMPMWRDKILARFPQSQKRDLHFRQLKHEQKIVACQEIAQFPLHACAALSHKITLSASLKRKGYLYNFVLRWVLERVIDFCEKDAIGFSPKLRVVFSRRANTNYQTMKEYLALLKEGRDVVKSHRTTNWKILDIDGISVENHKKWAGLQLADVITSAIFAGVEPNPYGNFEHAYGKLLKPRLMADKNGNCLNTGFVPMPSWGKCAANEQQQEFITYFSLNPRLFG